MAKRHRVRDHLGIALLFALPLGLGTPAPAQTFTDLADFNGPDGAIPRASVVLDAAGNIYGQAQGGLESATRCPAFGTGCGLVYKLDPLGNLTTLVAFDGADGAGGVSGLTLVGDRLYGAAISDSGSDAGYGLIFTVKTDGSDYRVLHRFDGEDGDGPNYTLIVTPKQDIYGITEGGGIDFHRRKRDPGGYGVLFQIARDGTFSLLHEFTNQRDGSIPNGIVMSPGGIIYGSTYTGACLSTGTTGCSAIYAYATATGTFTTLYNTSSATLLELSAISAAGDLYGASSYGGTQSLGSLFLLKALQSGKYLYSDLYSFTGQADGQYPFAGPVTKHGVLYGTTVDSGKLPNTNGTLYSFAKGVFTVLYGFPGTPGTPGVAPSAPYAAPTPGKGGVLYGTTFYGGPNLPCTDAGVTIVPNAGCGTIYRLGP